MRATAILISTLIFSLACDPRQPEETSVDTTPDPSLEPSIAAAIRSDGSVPEDLYRERSFRPIWTSLDGLTDQGREFLDALHEAETEGLHPHDYGVAELERGVRNAYLRPLSDPPASAEEIAALEVAFSRSFLRYARHLSIGRMAPSAVYEKWHLDERTFDPLAFARTALGHGVRDALREIGAEHPGYPELRDALARLRAVQTEGGWPPVESGPVLEKGDSGSRVLALRRRLAGSGDLEGGLEDARFDEEVERAVKRFQLRHGIEPTGSVGEGTRVALNVPIEQRIEQVELNMERHRWLPADFGAEYVAINIPEFHLHGYRGRELLLEMSVIVGKPMQQTPVFADRIEHVVFHPYWNVPESIALGEILPQWERDPGYLEAQGYEVVSGGGVVIEPSRASREDFASRRVYLRKPPGPGNDLGRIKFIFPNDHNVYLHDTPAEHLFAASERDFSHGCIRVERPEELAAFLLEDQWTRDDIDRALEAGENRWVALRDPVPVYLLYKTAWEEEGGTLQFRNDVYGLDALLWQALHPECVPCRSH